MKDHNARGAFLVARLWLAEAIICAVSAVFIPDSRWWARILFVAAAVFCARWSGRMHECGRDFLLLGKP